MSEIKGYIDLIWCGGSARDLPIFSHKPITEPHTAKEVSNLAFHNDISVIFRGLPVSVLGSPGSQ